MAEKNFAVMPSINISRTKFIRTSQTKTTFNLGAIVPLYVDEILPGDTVEFPYSALIRMGTPIAPIMDDIEMELFAFFVPNRLLLSGSLHSSSFGAETNINYVNSAGWKRIMGESPVAGIPNAAVISPLTLNLSTLQPQKLGDYLCLPNKNNVIHNGLIETAYVAIYNRWFRDQNVEAPVDLFATATSHQNLLLGDPFVAYKKSDYFTRALPYAQKSAPITLPLGSVAPLKTGTEYAISSPFFGYSGASDSNNLFPLFTQYASGNHNMQVAGTASSVSTSAVDRTNLYADLSNATAATISSIRYAFALQKLTERDCMGTRYWEVLHNHFLINAPDASLQDPEFLGGSRFFINIDQVLQQSETSTTPLGTPGGNSVTGNKDHLFTKSFVEHGILMILGCARQRQHTYGQGMDRMNSRFGRYDFFWPEFSNLSAQAILNKELYHSGIVATDDAIFGYQEAWAEYRYKPSKVTGWLNGRYPSSMRWWTLADVYTGTPTLSSSFLKETRDNLKEALVNQSGPDFIADFYWNPTYVRPMPAYSIPGLIDHH